MHRVGTKPDQISLYQALTSAHRIYVTSWLLDSSGDFLRDLSDAMIDGLVTVDANAETTRALDLTLFDPGGKIRITPDSPSRVSVFIADMIKVVVTVLSADRKTAWHIPVFCGPVDSVERDDYTLIIKALGKESLSLANTWRGKTFRKGQRKTDVIQDILTDLIGETTTNIPDLPDKLPRNMKLSHSKAPWKVAKALARSMGYQLFYNGDGVATMRKVKTRRPVMHLDENWLTTKPRATYDLDKTINAVWVRGRKHKKGKVRVEYKAVAKRKHPLSPWNLGRNGVPRYLWTEIDDDSIRSKKAAKKVARAELKSGLLAGLEVTFNGLPNYALQEQDLCRVDTENYGATVRMDQFTIPLVAGVDSTYGYLKKIQPRGNPLGVRRPRRGYRTRGHVR